MAFVNAGVLALSRSSLGRTCAQGARVRVARRARWTATTADSGTETDTADAPTETAYAPPALEIDGEALKERAMAVASDVSTRPGYYIKIAGYVAGAAVGLTILRAVVSAVDAIPILPAVLELVGLGYTAWFVWRYVLFKESREELMEEIEVLIGRARPPAE